jgi:DNA-binding transcriptional LysR family regulator
MGSERGPLRARAPRAPTGRWIELNLRHFQALQAVAEEASFNRAADRLGYTQSAVSQQIAALERIVGERLIDRRKSRPVTLTEAGRLLLEHLQAISARLDAAQADLQALQKGAGGRLKVGRPQSVGSRMLAGLLQRFSTTFANVEIELHEATSDAALLDLVERGDLDLTLADLPLPAGPFEWAEIVRDPYVLVVARDSPLATRTRAPTLREIAGLPLVGFRDPRSHGRMSMQLSASGVDPKFALRSDDNDTTQAIAEAGLGVALLPKLAVDLENPRTAVIELDAGLPPRIVAIVWNRDRHPFAVVRAFVEVAKRFGAELQQPPCTAKAS